MDFNNNENYYSPIFEPFKRQGSQEKRLNDEDSQGEKNSESSNSSDNNYNLERRMGRECSINVQPSKDNKFYKLIIPYNFEEKIYLITDKEIEFYEHNDYLVNKLKVFNSNTVFDIESSFKAKGFRKIKLFLLFVIILAILIYISLIIITLFCFNPIVIYTLFSWNRKAYNSLRMFKFILLEKYKMMEIKRNIDNENLSKDCQDKKIKWAVGQSGYWLEIQKIID